jgi:hypothetical protein
MKNIALNKRITSHKVFFNERTNMIQRKMIIATFSAALLTFAIVGASYILLPSQRTFSSPILSSQTFALILGTSLGAAIVMVIAIMVLMKRRNAESDIDSQRLSKRAQTKPAPQ